MCFCSCEVRLLEHILKSMKDTLINFGKQLLEEIQNDDTLFLYFSAFGKFSLEMR